MATTNVVIDPVTRVEGHLRIQATATEVKNTAGQTLYHEVKTPALSSSTMVRGIEQIMTGRDPRDTWAFAQRICGVCTVVHGLTSVRAVEQAIGVVVPKNAELIRNMMIGAQYVHDHVMHFYHLHALDWVDVVSALTANAANTATLAKGANPNHKPNNGALPDANYFQAKIDLLTGLATSNQLGLFNNGYWGTEEGGNKHPAYKLTPEQNLLLVCHYLEALGWAREVVKLHTVFGGRDPHPHMVVGGVPISPSAGSNSTALNTAGFTAVQKAITTMKAFVDNVYLPDTLLLAGLNKGAPNYKTLPNYTEWANYGATAGNFLCYGEFANATASSGFGIVDGINQDKLLIPHGVILNLSNTATTAVRQVFNVLSDTTKVTENVEHAWYSYTGTDKNLHPRAGQTTLNYTGPAPGTPASPGNANIYNLDENDKYSWIKSPRWNQLPMEVGPLAHVLMMYARNTLTTDQAVKKLVDDNWTSSTTGLGLPLGKLNSTFGRIFSRTVETKIIADAMQGWYNALVANKTAAYSTPTAFAALAGYSGWSGDKVGVGFTEAPRGALGHWVKIAKANGKVSQYQCIVASQWNAGPRDVAGVPGPYETALQGHRLADPLRPVEILRTIHSFDPCIGCAVHIVDPNGEPLVKVNVNHAYR